MPEALPFEYSKRWRNIRSGLDPRVVAAVEQHDRELEDFLGLHLPATGGTQKYAHMQTRWIQNWTGASYDYTDILITSGADGVAALTQDDTFGPGIQVHEDGLYLATVDMIAVGRVAVGVSGWSKLRTEFFIEPIGGTTNPALGLFTEMRFVNAADTDGEVSVSNALHLSDGDIFLNPSITFTGSWRHASLDMAVSLIWISPTVPYNPCA